LSRPDAGYVHGVADLIAAVVIIVGGASAAELVRANCRRQLLAPVRVRARR